MGSLRCASLVVLFSIYFSSHQVLCADPVYVESPTVDWVKSCKKYTGRSYHVFAATDCKSYYLCVDGKHVDPETCEGDTRFSEITAQCEPDIECFIKPKKDEDFTWAEKAQLFMDSLEAVDFYNSLQQTTTTTESPSTTPDRKVDPADFSVFTDFLFPFIQRLLRDPDIRYRLNKLSSTAQEKEKFGLLDVPENATYSEMRQLFRNASIKAIPAMTQFIKEKMPVLFKVIQTNTKLFKNLQKDLAMKLTPLRGDLFKLLMRYSEIASSARREAFELDKVHKDIMSFATLFFINMRRVVYDVYAEKVKTAFISV